MEWLNNTMLANGKDHGKCGPATSASGTVILSSQIKEQLRSIIPRTPCSATGGGCKGIGEGDILCKVKGFVAACRGVASEEVLEGNFPDELEVKSTNGRNRFFLRDADVPAEPLIFEISRTQESATVSERNAVVKQEESEQHHLGANRTSAINTQLKSSILRRSVVKQEPDRVESASETVWHKSPGFAGNILRVNVVKQEPQEQEIAEHGRGNVYATGQEDGRVNKNQAATEQNQQSNSKRPCFRSSLWQKTATPVPTHNSAPNLNSNHETGSIISASVQEDESTKDLRSVATDDEQVVPSQTSEESDSLQRTKMVWQNMIPAAATYTGEVGDNFHAQGPSNANNSNQSSPVRTHHGLVATGQGATNQPTAQMAEKRAPDGYSRKRGYDLTSKDNIGVGGGLSSNNISSSFDPSLSVDTPASRDRGLSGISNKSTAWAQTRASVEPTDGYHCNRGYDVNAVQRAKEGKTTNEPVQNEARALGTGVTKDNQKRGGHKVVRPTGKSQIPTLSDETKEKILSILPEKRNGVKGASMNYIISNVHCLIHEGAQKKMPIRAVFEANLSEHIEIEVTGKNGACKRYYLQSKQGCNGQDHMHAQDESSKISDNPLVGGGLISHTPNPGLGIGRGISNQHAWMTRQQAVGGASGISSNILKKNRDCGNYAAAIQDSPSPAESSCSTNDAPANSAESEVVALLQNQEQNHIELGKLMHQYYKCYGKVLSHGKKLRPFLKGISGVILVKRQAAFGPKATWFATLDEKVTETKAMATTKSLSKSMIVQDSTATQEATSRSKPSLSHTSGLGMGRGINNQPAWMTRQQGLGGPTGISCNIQHHIAEEGNNAASIQDSSESTGAGNCGKMANDRKETAGMLTPANTAEFNIVELIQKRNKELKPITMSDLKLVYNNHFQTDLCHKGKLKSFLGQIEGVKLVKGSRKSKDKGKGTTEEYYVTLDRKKLDKVKPLAQETNATHDTTSFHESMVVHNRATSQEKLLAKETKAATDAASLNESVVVDSRSAMQENQLALDTKPSTIATSLPESIAVENNQKSEESKIDIHKTKQLLKLTLDQAMTCTKFPPGCRVVCDYQEEYHSNNHAGAQICFGKVDSVHISLSHATKGQLKYEIKVRQSHMLIDEENLAYAPQVLVCCQSNGKEEPATILSCHKNEDGQFIYSILVGHPDGEAFLMKQNVRLDELCYRGDSLIVHDLPGKEPKEESAIDQSYTSQRLSTEQTSKKRQSDQSDGRGIYQKRARV